MRSESLPRTSQRPDREGATDRTFFCCKSSGNPAGGSLAGFEVINEPITQRLRVGGVKFSVLNTPCSPAGRNDLDDHPPAALGAEARGLHTQEFVAMGVIASVQGLAALTAESVHFWAIRASSGVP